MRRVARSLEHEASGDLRRTTVRAVSAGSTRRAAARAAGVHEMTASTWMAAYRTRGERLIEARRAPGAAPKLSARQVETLRRAIVGKKPDQLNFGVALWKSPALGRLVERKSGIVLHATTIMGLSHRIGITPQKPVRQSVRRDDIAVRRWTTEELPKVVREARRKRAASLYLDETGVHVDHAVGTTRAAVGKAPLLRDARVTGGAEARRTRSFYDEEAGVKAARLVEDERVAGAVVDDDEFERRRRFVGGDRREAVEEDGVCEARNDDRDDRGAFPRPIGTRRRRAQRSKAIEPSRGFASSPIRDDAPIYLGRADIEENTKSGASKFGASSEPKLPSQKRLPTDGVDDRALGVPSLRCPVPVEGADSMVADGPVPAIPIASCGV
jgi:transposase